MGFECFVVDDATAAFERAGYDGRRYSAEEIHSTALASLNGEFAEVVVSEDLLRLIGRCGQDGIYPSESYLACSSSFSPIEASLSIIS